MQIDDKLYRSFLEEMDNLETFRMNYLSSHSSIPLEREDPDVRRLIEALAFFNARTRMAGRRNIDGARLRLFRQFFSFLLTPSPSMGLIQCKINNRFMEPVNLAKGSEFAISCEDNPSAIFRTIHDMNMLPITFRKAQMILQKNRGFRLLLHFDTPYARNDDIGTLNLYISHLNNYTISLRMLHTIKKHLQKVSIVFNEKADEHSQGSICPVYFGSPGHPEGVENTDVAHPLQKVCHFFHFPQQEMYMNVQVNSVKRNWKDFTLCLDFDDKWPRNLNINKDMFQLFVVPVINLHHSFAEPILCDGTQDRYVIRHPDPRMKYHFQSILGVYQAQEEGMVPLKAGILSGGAGSYEIEHFFDKKGVKRHWVVLNLPQAFENPKTVSIDALWYHPWFSQNISENVDVVLNNRNIQGATWDTLESLRAHKESILDDDSEKLLELLSLQTKSTLGLEEVLFIMRNIADLENSPFKNIPILLQELQVQDTIDAKSHRLKHVYRIVTKEADISMRPLLEEFLRQILSVLKAYTTGNMVSLEVKITGEDQALKFE